MTALSSAALRWPRRALTVWLVAVVALGAGAAGIQERLHPSILIVKHTEEARAQALAESAFGKGYNVVVLLQGPPAELARQGRALTQRLAHRPRTQVLSPWVSGVAPGQLRPTARSAL